MLILTQIRPFFMNFHFEPRPVSAELVIFIFSIYAALNIYWGTSCNFRALSSRQTVYQRRYLPLKTYLSLKYKVMGTCLE